MAAAPHEVELKLRIPAAATARLLRHPALAPLKRGRARTTKLDSIYFDTPDRRLADAGVALRLRRAGRDWLQTIKGPATPDSGGGLAQRVECEWRIARSAQRPPLDLRRLAETPYRRTIEKATRHAPLAPVFMTSFERTTIQLRFDDHTTAQLCFDRGSVHAGERAGRDVAHEPIVEVELELETGNAARLFDLAIALAADLPIAIENRSKATRGYALVTSRRNTAVHAEPIVLPDRATAAAALAAIVRNCLRQVGANADGVLLDEASGWIHQMRVGARRQRSALALARGALPPGALRPLMGEWRWLAAALGRVRDLDVFGGQTLPRIAAASQQVSTAGNASSRDLDDIAVRASAQAFDARRDARAAIASPRFTQLLLATGRLAALPLLGADPSASQAQTLQRPARSFAVDQLARRHRKLHRAGKQLEESPEQRHAARIAAKKLRYAAEFFAPLFPGKPAGVYRKVLVRLQEELGIANDAVVAATLAADLAAPGSPSAALVAGWAGANAQAHTKRLARAWRAFEKMKPFWSGA